MYKVGDEVSVKGEITKVCESGVVVKAHYFGEAYFDRSNMDLIGKTYEQGLADAWELAKKIRVQPRDGGIPNSELEEIFGTTFIDTIFKNNTCAEALAKIEAYEKEKEIKVKDIVIYHDCPGTGVVTYVDSEHTTVMWENGRFGEYQKCYLEKTGETADCLDDLFRQIGE